jgi:predicted esterase
MILEIRDSGNKVVLRKNLLVQKNRSIPLSNFPTGIYNITLFTDSTILNQHFFYGDYKNYFASLNANFKILSPDYKTQNNITVLTDRFNYIDTIKVRHDNAYERKVSDNLSELTELYLHLKQHTEPFRNIKGLHIRAQNCADHKADSYMIYIPIHYQANKSTALVVMLPHLTILRPFNFSTYVSDIDRIEHICKLADRYNYAVLWSSFRVYNHHALTETLSNDIFETVNEIKKDYNIDTTRLFAYGDCAGGEIGLFLANKHPSYFAAVAVEGPAIPIRSKLYSNSHEVVSRKYMNYDFYNSLENYKNQNIFIIHSVYDQKANFKNSKKLVDESNRLGANIILKKCYVKKGDNSFYFFINLMPDNKNLTDMFKFYQNKKTNNPDTLSFSTWELKYNKSFWLTINDIIQGRKATVMARFDRLNNKLFFTTSNVLSLSINTRQLNLNPKNRLTVFINGSTVFSGFSNNITVNIPNTELKYSPKNTLTEGPENNFFANPFMVISGTQGNIHLRKLFDAAVDIFKQDWQTHFFEDTCRLKKDNEISKDDILKYNLLLIGSKETNQFFQKIAPMLPVEISDDKIKIGSHVYKGKNLSFMMIYPNPLNPQKYILVGSSNCENFDTSLVKDIYFNGWFDYTISSNGVIIGNGDFNQNWK